MPAPEPGMTREERGRDGRGKEERLPPKYIFFGLLGRGLQIEQSTLLSILY